jgi:hypothetical protein
VSAVFGRGFGPRWRAAHPWVLLGLALGTASLLRQVFLLVLPVLALWMLWAAGHLRADKTQAARARWATVRGLLISVVVVILMIAPWTVRNYLAFGRFVPLNTNAGYAFFWGNHPIYGTNFVPILSSTSYQELIPSELRALDEAALDSALMSRGLSFVVNDPGRYVLLSISRTKDYFVFWASPESSPTSNVARLLSFGLYLPFMLVGLIHVAIRVRRRSAAQLESLVLLYFFVAFYALLHLLTWTLIRYRLPIDAVLMPFAALAMLDVWGWVSARGFAIPGLGNRNGFAPRTRSRTPAPQSR